MSLNHRYYRTLPRWGRRLNKRFVAAFGKPAGLWTPCDVVNKAYDFSENLNTGILNGGVTVATGGFGVLGQQWVMGGSKNISLGTGLRAGGLSKLSVAVVFNLSATGTIQTPFAKWAPTKEWKVGILTGGQPYFDLTSNGTDDNYRQSSVGASIGAPALFVGVYDGSASRLDAYFNGIKSNGALTGTVPATIYSGGDGSTVYLGAQDGVASNPLTGSLLFCAVWTGTALSDAQVSSLYSCILYGEPFPLFQSQIIKRRFSTRQNIVSSFKFRRTLSQFGTRIGSRQAIG